MDNSLNGSEDPQSLTPPLFGFAETPDLASIRRNLEDLLRTAGPNNPTTDVKNIFDEYEQQAEKIISPLAKVEYLRANLGLKVAKALIYSKAGWLDAERGELEDAWEVALGMGLDQEFSQLLTNLGYPGWEEDND